MTVCSDIRRRVLDAWTASPERFREDANAEHDARTGYRDRLVVELAQNAVDAGGSRLLLRLRGSTLLAANDGAPLTPDGVVGLSTLRASAKRDGSTFGRFGVGFAAVLAVTDAPSIGSVGGPSVTWSADRVRAEIAPVPALVAEAARRGGQVPVLRLPFDAAPLDVPDGFTTAVVLPLTDVAGARALLSSVEETLPLLLRGLGSVVIDLDGSVREIRCSWGDDHAVLGGRRWEHASASGALTPSGPEDPSGWRIDAYAPVDGVLDLPQVLHAPTPTDEPLSLPVLLSVTAPLEPTRRRLVDGPLGRELLARAGEVVAALMARLLDPRPLVPLGLDDGWVDACVRASLLAALPETPVLQGLPGPRCAVLEPGLEPVAPLLDVAGLLTWPASAALDVLGVRRLDTAAVLELLGARSPAGWREVYAALADAPDRDALAALPVPLADGRVVTGVRGVLVPTGPLPPEVSALPLRLVHPDAAHPLLERLGAVPATAAGLLDDDELRAAVDEAGFDLDLARAVCALVREAHAAPAWVAGTLLLPGSEGPEVAGDLLLPGGLLHRAGADLPLLLAPDWLDPETACTAGVLDLPQLTEDPDVDGYDEWLATLPEEPVDPVLVRDLDLCSDLGVLLDGVLGDRVLRAVLPGYLGWWLGSRGALGAPARELALGLPDLFDQPPALPEDVLAALGVWTSLDDVVDDRDAAGDLLDRVGDAERTVTGARAAEVYARCAERWADDPPEPPLAVRLLDGSVAPADRALVVDAPDLLPLCADRAVLVGDAALADLLDLDLASERWGPPSFEGVETPAPQGFSGSYVRCTSLAQDGVALPWRLHDGVLYATAEGLADGLAWAHGQWSRRHTVRAVLADPSRRARLEIEDAF